MSAMVLALGDLEHIHNKQNLKLRTNGSIFLLSFQAQDLPLFCRPQDLEALVSSGTWVASGNRLRICFHIFFDDIVVSGSDVSDVIEDLGIALCNTEIWLQLDLQASLSLPGDDNDRSKSPSDIILSLTSQPSSHVHIKPPKLIPAAHLEAINLTFNFSTCRRSRVSPKGQQQSIQSEDVDSTQEGEAELTYKKMDQPSGLQSSGQGLPSITSHGEGGGLLTLPTGTLISSMDEIEDQGALSQKYFTTLSPLDCRESVSSTDRLIPATNGPRSSQNNNSHRTYATHQVDFGDTFRMVNASLHTMLYGRLPGSRGKSGGVIVSSDEGFPKLVTLSPALFNPGYAQAISDRDGFHSTIAYTMTGIHRRTKSATLKRRLDRLLDLAPDKYLGEDRILSPSSGLSSLNLTDAINVRLWLLTKSKVFDPLASRKLKPLDTSKRTSDKGITSSSMLEDALRVDRADQPLFDIQNGDPSIDSQHTFIEEKPGYSGYLFEELDALEADNSHDLFEEFLTFDEDKVALFDGRDGELLFESQGSLTEEDVGHTCIPGGQYSDDGLLREGQCLVSQHPPENYLLGDGDKEPRFGNLDEDLLLESQHRFMDGGQDASGIALDNSDVMETEDLEDDMLMDGRCNSTTTWGVLDEYSHELLDASAKDILEGRHELLNDEVEDILDDQGFGGHKSCFAEDQSRNYFFQNPRLEDEEMGLTC